MAARKIWCGHEPMILKLTIHAGKEVPVKIVVADANQDYTMFTNRTENIVGQKDIFVRMPLSPWMAAINIYNVEIGNVSDEKDNSFHIVNIEKVPLEKKADLADIDNAIIKSFVIFAQKFSYNAGVLPVGNYISTNRLFFIRYVDEIRGYVNANGQYVDDVVPTPFRISVDDGLIEADRKAVQLMTVPMRVALLFHEFAHFWLNKEMNDEQEADLNALYIYLGLGYPRLEAKDAFIETFEGNQTAANEERAALINDFIDNFDNQKTIYRD